MSASEPVSPQARLARLALETLVQKGVTAGVPEPLPDELATQKGCFVSLHSHGDLRGCMGTVTPLYPTLAEEIISNAIAAGSRDPRFRPVEERELDHIQYSVDVLNTPEEISGLEGHDPRRYGLIVEGMGRTGLLLPDLEGVDTPDRQFSICCSKAGLTEGAPVQLYRFTVSRYE